MYATSTPRAANALSVLVSEDKDGVDPTMNCISDGAPLSAYLFPAVKLKSCIREMARLTDMSLETHAIDLSPGRLDHLDKCLRRGCLCASIFDIVVIII